MQRRPETETKRPQKRGDCLAGGFNCERPCPFVACKYHLYLDVIGKSVVISSHVPVWDMKETCALDVVDRFDGGLPLECVTDIVGLSKERIRQIEVGALKKLRAKLTSMGVVYGDGESDGEEEEES